jgi:type IV pilus assembly protein PilA
VKCALLYVGDTKKHLKIGVHLLMPTRLKGMTSLEIAILVAIVLIIAVAVGWYVYTTFIASATGQPRITILSAEITVGSGPPQLKVRISNPGPVPVRIERIEIEGSSTPLLASPHCGGGNLGVGGQVECSGPLSGFSVPPGTVVSGRVILSGGHSFPFNAAVKPAT